MRSQVALAAKGDGAAQRALMAAVHALEQELSIEYDAAEKAAAAKPQYTIREAARRVALLLELAKKEPEAPLPGKLEGDPRAGAGRGDLCGPSSWRREFALSRI
jgi:hypothetical protein